VLNADGALCISRTVADDLRSWAEHSGWSRQRPFRIGWFPLGADIANAAPSQGLAQDAPQTLAAFAARPTFLMVGTIEPRKGHLQVLDAFDQLWSQGVDANLAIVGAEGWRNVPPHMRRTIPEILARLRSHPERKRRLFWVNEPSDEYLEKIYAASTCLIAAAEGEGFGLPLIEAARHRVPIIARDIPIFREVAGGHAFYFTGLQPEALAAAIKEWLTLYGNGNYPKSDAMPWMTWAQSVERLKDVVLRGDWYASISSESRQDPGRRERPGEREQGVGAEVAPG
jgi:glycosyltransferase involved in cell wall biosynthesis